MLLRLINGAAQRKVNTGLKDLIKRIQYWLMSSLYYKKDILEKRAQAPVGFEPELSFTSEASAASFTK